MKKELSVASIGELCANLDAGKNLSVVFKSASFSGQTFYIQGFVYLFLAEDGDDGLCLCAEQFDEVIAYSIWPKKDHGDKFTKFKGNLKKFVEIATIFEQMSAMFDKKSS